MLGLHLSAMAPAWEISRIEPRMEMVKEAGIGLLEIPVARPDAFDAARAKDFARRWNVELFMSARLPSPIDPLESPQDGLDALEPALRMAAEAGSLGLGGVFAGGLRGAPSQQRIDAFCRFAERAARLARPFGVRLALEPGNRAGTPLLSRAAQAAWSVERVGAENLFIGLDTSAMNSEEDSLSGAVEAAAPFLGAVALSESNRGLPGRGLLDWPGLFKALADIGYAGPLVVKADPPADPALPAPWRVGDVRLEALVEEGVPFLRERAQAAGFTLG